MTAASRHLELLQPERRAGLVVRVSTDLQAANDEGSLKTQLQRLREHIRYKSEAVGEPWSEAAVYELRGVSGKNSVRSKEFERLYADIRSGLVNTVVCTSLDRICRSVVDFLHFFEFLSEHGAQFVCLKQQYDTTSPQGRLFVTIMMALAQFEREQTAERTREATAARAERGLWNGGHLYGYDLDSDKKGFLVINSDEAVAVNFAFKTYLGTGSIGETVTALNSRGFRTKAFSSRRGVEHPAKEFAYTTVQHLLKNPAYIGKKVIDVRGERRTVEAVWPGIVDTEVFEEAQKLLGLNSRANHSQVKAVRHVHALGGGRLRCGRCGAEMQGRSGTGRLGKTYFYYVCIGEGCGFRVSAPEVEGAVIQRLGLLACEPETVSVLVEKANRVMAAAKPGVEKRARSIKRTLRQVKGDVDQVARGLARATTETAGLLNEQLIALSRRREELECALVETEREMREVDRAAVSAAEVIAGLQDFGRVFPHLRPYEQKRLVHLLLKGASVGDRELVLEIYGGACRGFADGGKPDGGRGFAVEPEWLPDLDSNQEHRG